MCMVEGPREVEVKCFDCETDADTVEEALDDSGSCPNCGSSNTLVREITQYDEIGDVLEEYSVDDWYSKYHC